MTKNTIKYGGIELNKVNQSNINVPTSCIKIQLKPADKKAIAIAYKNNIATLLVGETGTGKTTAIKELAFLLNQGFTRVSLTGYTTPDELIGSKSVKDGATYYENGIITKAMIEGHIVVLDELNAITPDTSFIIHSLLDDEKNIVLPNGDKIKPHPDFRLFATINPDYEGTKTLNRAFLDRFGVILNIDIVSPATEKKILVDRCGISEKQATELVAVAWLNRKAYMDKKTLTLISTRSLLQVAELIKNGLEIKDAYNMAVVNKATTDDKMAFMDFFNIVYKTNEIAGNNLPLILLPDEVAQMEKEKADNKALIETASQEVGQSRAKINDLTDKLADAVDTIKALRTGINNANANTLPNLPSPF